MYNIMRKIIQLFANLISVYLLIGSTFAEEVPKDDFLKYYSSNVDQSYSTNVYCNVYKQSQVATILREH